MSEEQKTDEKIEKNEQNHHKNKHFAELEKKIKHLENEKLQKQKEIDEQNKKIANYLNTAAYYKVQAEETKKDFERFKERNKNIEIEAKQNATEWSAKKLLPIIDNFDQAIAHITDAELIKGLSMIYSSLLSVLSELGIEEIKAKNENLNPELHNCISTEETENLELDGKIATVYQKGYKVTSTNKVIRPATVSVYKNN